MTIVSFSEVYCYQTCQRQYYYKFGLGLRPNDGESAANRGSTGHKLMENFYKGVQLGLSKEEAREAIKTSYEGKAVDALKTWVLVDNYINGLDITDFSLYVEKPFKHLIEPESDLIIAFTPDLLWQHRTGYWVVDDYKFVSRSWPSRQLARFCQIKLYIGLLRRMGFDVPRGFIRFFNLETGGMPHQKYEPTDIEIDNLLKEFTTIALEVADFKNLPVAAQRLSAIRTFNDTICRWCSFVYPCTLELEGKDASRTLATQYTQNDYGYE